MRARDLVLRARIAWYRRLWTCAHVSGAPELRSPLLLAGAGTIAFEGHVTFGWEQGPGYLEGYSYVEARAAAATITFGDGTHLNNGVTIVAEGPGIAIGRRCVVGPGVHVYDSDFHALAAADRAEGRPATGRVRVEDDVFLGTACLLMKGVTVGAGSVVGAGAVVVGDVPPATVVAGNPARALR